MATVTKYHVRLHNDMPAHMRQDGTKPVRKAVRNVPADLTYYDFYSGIYMPRSRNFLCPCLMHMQTNVHSTPKIDLHTIVYYTSETI